MARDKTDDEITLGLLAALETNSTISQRSLSGELGVALGLANSYLKRCVRKGLVKVQQVPRRRYAYYLTPKGFAEKARLTGEYLTSSLQFYRRARGQLADIMENCAENGMRRIVLAGVNELSEIATLTAHDHNVRLIGIVDSEATVENFCGLQVARSLSDYHRVHAVILTETRNFDALWQEFIEKLGEEHVFAPQIVRLAQAQANKVARKKESRSPTKPGSKTVANEAAQ